MSLENPHIIIQQLAPFEDIPQKRLFPMRAARAHLSGSTPQEASTQLDAEFATNSPGVLTDEEQEEKLALFGIVISWMVNGANAMREHRPPYGLIYSESGLNEGYSDNNIKVVQNANLLGDPFSTFSFAIRHTFAHALRMKLEKVFASPERNEAAIYRRYMEFVNRNGAKPNDPYGIKHTVFLSNTGLRIMEDILANAHDIDSTSLGRKVTTDESVNAARNSTPLILKLSSFEQNVFDTILRSMNDGGIWRSLKIVEIVGKMYYQIKHPVLRHAIDQLSRPEIEEKVEKKSRGGCPARMRFEGKESAIETLWNWYIDYSVQVLQLDFVDPRGVEPRTNLSIPKAYSFASWWRLYGAGH